MKRKEFLKGIGLAGLTATTFGVFACSSDDESALAVTEDEGDGLNNSSSTCSITNSETAGPFPTKSPSTLERVDITGDRTGILLDINLIIQDVSDSCNVYENAVVDIWHCDKDGNYSEYGNTGMQPTDYTSYHFLRGRQLSNAAGEIKFKSIFPGWYSGRATHIHVHIYNTTGTSLLVTQIAFPEGSDSAVVTVNASSDNGYTKGMSGYTYNANDNVFSDGTENELCTITGDIDSGFSLSHTINISS